MSSTEEVKRAFLSDGVNRSTFKWYEDSEIVDIERQSGTITLRNHTKFTFSPGISQGRTSEERTKVTLPAGAFWYAEGDSFHIPSTADRSKLEGYTMGTDSLPLLKDDLRYMGEAR
ncbi:hypothetical protein I204_06390 [Kwoniella mangroviensis CBS 8886]|nr:hypothetical protein I204_06390 [Kwoniella mangroviensis CBS 8886]